jgi:hypothetical protein
MAIVGVLETELHAGTINADTTFSAHHNFGASTIWSRPYLQQVSVNDNDGSVILWINKFVDATGTTHPGPFSPGIFSKNCTAVFFSMYTNDCIATAVLTTEFFG